MLHDGMKIDGFNEDEWVFDCLDFGDSTGAGNDRI